MERFTAIIVASSNSQSKINKNSEQEILFAKSILWVKKAVRKNNIEKLLLTQNSTEQELDAFLKDSSSAVFLTAGDMPLISAKDIMNSLIYHKSGGQVATIFSTFSGAKTGIGWYNKDVLQSVLPQLEKDFTLENFYEMFKQNEIQSSIFSVDDSTVLTPDTPKTRALIAPTLRKQSIKEHLEKGVDIQLEDGIIIGPEVKIGINSEILPGTMLIGRTVIGKNCTIGPNSDVRDSTIEDGCVVHSSQIEQSKVGESTKIGPMSHLRPNSNLGKSLKIGNFVEIKNSNLGDSTSVSHLTYIGDSDVGEDCNFGCGVVTVNYDGKNKHRTTVGDNVFVGCNCNLIAPVKLADGSYAAAGTTVTDDVPKDSFVIGRERQTVKKDWCKKK